MRLQPWLALVLAGCGFQPTTGHGTIGDAPGSDAALVSDAHADAPPIDSPPPPDAFVPPARRKSITITGGQVKGPLTDFPVWLDVTDAELAAARADGTDLYVTDAAGAALPYEIRTWTQSTGHLQLWFKAPALDKNTNTVFYVRYGGASAAPAPAPAQVFSAYAAVWHLDDPLTGTAPVVADALGTSPGASTGLDSTRQVPGKLGGGINLDGSSMYVSFTNMLSGNTSSTISAWVSQRSANGFDTIVAVGTASANKSRFLYAVYNGGHVGDGFYANDVQDTGNDVVNKGFALLHWTYNGGTGKGSLFRDGSAVGGPHQYAAGVNTSGTNGWIGFADSGWGGTNYLNGIVDEVRIAKTELSSDWIGTEFNNQSAPAGFYTIGAAQPVP